MRVPSVCSVRFVLVAAVPISAGQFFFLQKKEALEAFGVYDRFVFECVQLDTLLTTSRVRGR